MLDRRQLILDAASVDAELSLEVSCAVNLVDPHVLCDDIPSSIGWI
jgi:hypothetical protein